MDKIKTVFNIIVSCLALIFLLFQDTNADEAKGKVLKRTTAAKEMQGEISGISKRYISLIYERNLEKGTEEEILLPLAEQAVTLEHIRDLKQLGVGDTIGVQYDEESTQYEDKSQESKIKLKIISFIRKSPPKPQSTYPEEGEQPGALISD